MMIKNQTWYCEISNALALYTSESGSSPVIFLIKWIVVYNKEMDGWDANWRKLHCKESALLHTKSPICARLHCMRWVDLTKYKNCATWIGIENIK
jgi:hypothetical protein